MAGKQLKKEAEKPLKKYFTVTVDGKKYGPFPESKRPEFKKARE